MHIFSGSLTRPIMSQYACLLAVPTFRVVVRTFNPNLLDSSSLIISLNKLPESIRHLVIQFRCTIRTRTNPRAGFA